MTSSDAETDSKPIMIIIIIIIIITPSIRQPSDCPVRLAQLVERCGFQSEGPGQGRNFMPRGPGTRRGRRHFTW